MTKLMSPSWFMHDCLVCFIQYNLIENKNKTVIEVFFFRNFSDATQHFLASIKSINVNVIISKLRSLIETILRVQKMTENFTTVNKRNISCFTRAFGSLLIY